MKKIAKLFAATAFALTISFAASAQDLSAAAELYKTAATALNEGNNATALDGFQKALTSALALGEEGAELATDCKNIIPKIILQLGKEAAAAKDMDKAITHMKEAQKLATEYGLEEVAKDAKEFIPQIFLSEGNTLLNAGKFAEAAAEYLKATELDPDNGMAFLRLGMAKARTADEDGAVAALEKAAELGQKANAAKQLGGMYAKKAVAAYKAKKNTEALAAALKSIEYAPNNQVAKVGGICAFNAKKYADAIKLLEPLVTPDAKSMDVKYYLARAFEGAGNNAKACEFYKMITSDARFAAFAKSKVGTLCK